MQHMIRWQVEAIKSEITGVVVGFRIVTLKWSRTDDTFGWSKIIPVEVESIVPVYGGSLDDLDHKEYMKLMKIVFINAYTQISKMSANFYRDILDYDNRKPIQTVGLNWIQFVYEKENQDELDRRTVDENRVSDHSETTREC